MAGNRIICTKNNVDYLTIRKAMCVGARTESELCEKCGVCLECEGCRTEIPNILTSVCGCMNVSLQAVIDAIKNGADTVDKVGEVTGAGTGTDCGKCKSLIANIIELGR